MGVPEVGPKVAEGVREFFSESANRKLIEHLRAVGVNMKEERQALVDTRFAGMTFVFTGTLAKRIARRSRSAGSFSRRQSGRLRQQEDQLRGGGRRRWLKAG